MIRATVMGSVILCEPYVSKSNAFWNSFVSHVLTPLSLFKVCYTQSNKSRYNKYFCVLDTGSVIISEENDSENAGMIFLYGTRIAVAALLAESDVINQFAI